MTTVILKPTDGCNANCRYCSAAHPGAARRMDGATLDRVFGLFAAWTRLRGNRNLKIIWHGGEPLLMAGSFWEEAFRGLEAHFTTRGITVENGIQTNATLVRPDTIPFLKRLLGDRGSVGTSIDPIPGIRELKGAPPGRYREDLDAALALLREGGIRYGLIYVVHRLALEDPGAIYRDLRRNHPGAGLRFNPLYRQGRAGAESVWDDLGITAREWGRALLDLHRAWEADGCPAGVHPFGPWRQLEEGGAWRLSCESSGKCAGGHFGVDPDGEVYLCGRSADGGTFRFGNAADLTAQDLQDHPNLRRVENRRAWLRRTHCRDCPWWLRCHGGCVNDAILGSGTPYAPTTFCEGLKAYFEAVREGGAA